MKSFTLDEQIAELKRELGVRERVYPKWIEMGRITKEKAEENKGKLQAAIKTMTGLIPVQVDLFDGR